MPHFTPLNSPCPAVPSRRAWPVHWWADPPTGVMARPILLAPTRLSGLTKGKTRGYLLMIYSVNLILKSSVIFIVLFSFFKCTKPDQQSIPLTSEFHYNRGLEYFKLNDPDNAEREFRFAIELNDHFAPAHLGLAILSYKNKQYAESEHHIDEAIRLKNHWTDAYLLKGKILFQKEQYDQALKILYQAEHVFKNENRNNRKALKSEIYLWRGLCLKKLGHHEMAAIELTAALKLDPNNQNANQALNDIRLISKMTAAYPQSVKSIINKKNISRADWAVLLITGLSKNFILKAQNQLPGNNLDLSDISSNDIIIKAVQKNLINVYPDGEFKPDLDLSWAEVIISAENILHALKTTDSIQKYASPFFDLSELHPLYDSAAMAASLGVFNNLSQQSFKLSESVKGMDAMHVIANLNRLIDARTF